MSSYDQQKNMPGADNNEMNGKSAEPVRKRSGGYPKRYEASKTGSELSREEKDERGRKCMEMMRLKNEEFRKRHELVLLDKINAEENNSSVTNVTKVQPSSASSNEVEEVKSPVAVVHQREWDRHKTTDSSWEPPEDYQSSFQRRSSKNFTDRKYNRTRDYADRQDFSERKYNRTRDFVEKQGLRQDRKFHNDFQPTEMRPKFGRGENNDWQKQKSDSSGNFRPNNNQYFSRGGRGRGRSFKPRTYDKEISVSLSENNVRSSSHHASVPPAYCHDANKHISSRTKKGSGAWSDSSNEGDNKLDLNLAQKDFEPTYRDKKKWVQNWINDDSQTLNKMSLPSNISTSAIKKNYPSPNYVKTKTKNVPIEKDKWPDIEIPAKKSASNVSKSKDSSKDGAWSDIEQPDVICPKLVVIKSKENSKDGAWSDIEQPDVICPNYIVSNSKEDAWSGIEQPDVICPNYVVSKSKDNSKDGASSGNEQLDKICPSYVASATEDICEQTDSYPDIEKPAETCSDNVEDKVESICRQNVSSLEIEKPVEKRPDDTEGTENVCERDLLSDSNKTAEELSGAAEINSTVEDIADAPADDVQISLDVQSVSLETKTPITNNIVNAVDNGVESSTSNNYTPDEPVITSSNENIDQSSANESQEQQCNLEINDNSGMNDSVQHSTLPKAATTDQEDINRNDVSISDSPSAVISSTNVLNNNSSDDVPTDSADPNNILSDECDNKCDSNDESWATLSESSGSDDEQEKVQLNN